MNDTNRIIAKFPFQQVSAEKIIKLAQESVLSRYTFLNHIKTVKDSNILRDGFMAFEDMEICNFIMKIEELIENTFPELMPIEWGDE